MELTSRDDFVSVSRIMAATSSKKSVLSIVGTRPNFMKVGPIEKAFRDLPHINHRLLHTGQHFDDNMSKFFFRDLGLPKPDEYLGISGGSLGDQTGRMMIDLEASFHKNRPDLIVVLGDVNSTFAAAWVGVQNHIPVVHVEAGLRSFDRKMPEEVNRLCTDCICDLLFTTHPSADRQLKSEGVSPEKIHMVGNVMVDTLISHRQSALTAKAWQRFELSPQGYGLITLHRPSNVDTKPCLTPLIETISTMAKDLPLIFPVHPRTLQNLKRFGLYETLEKNNQIHLVEPLGYLDFLSLTLSSALVVTDSGGLQEETTFLNIPCMTLRQNTERPFTVDEGSNYLLGTNPEVILSTFNAIQNGNAKQAADCATWLWDGQSGVRIAKKIDDYLNHGH